MGGTDDRKPEELTGAEANVFQNMLNQVQDFVMKLFGGQAKEEGKSNELMDKVKELSGNVVKNIVDFNDNILKQLKLDENEMIQNVQKQAKDFLKQAGLLEEEFEDEDYY
ncbi:MAG: hypothetical protein ACFFCS_05465 [Candidatus Hodarchaeota archaeon]